MAAAWEKEMSLDKMRSPKTAPPSEHSLAVLMFCNRVACTKAAWYKPSAFLPFLNVRLFPKILVNVCCTMIVSVEEPSQCFSEMDSIWFVQDGFSDVSVLWKKKCIIVTWNRTFVSLATELTLPLSTRIAIVENSQACRIFNISWIFSF